MVRLSLATLIPREFCSGYGLILLLLSTTAWGEGPTGETLPEKPRCRSPIVPSVRGSRRASIRPTWVWVYDRVRATPKGVFFFRR